MNAERMGPKKVKEVLAELKERFGFRPEAFAQYDFYINAKNKIFIVNKEASLLTGTYPKRLTNAGMLFARRDATVKPTSNMIQLFGRGAHKNVINLDKVKARIYIEGFDLDVKPPKTVKDGYVILKYDKNPMGCGLLKDGQIKNTMPKAKRMRLKYL
jgi:NOL1/NOP2/fmu family ribosome biogenesis protein